MATSIERLRAKLCRELAQSEHDAVIHGRREARRYGAAPPAQALRAIARHALEIRPHLATLCAGDQALGMRAGRLVGEVFSAVRQAAVDWVLAAERSYRATLLGLRHGLGVAQLLREVLVQQQDYEALRLCDRLLEDRTALVVRAEACLRWFAENPDLALRLSRMVERRQLAARRLEARTRANRLAASRG